VGLHPDPEISAPASVSRIWTRPSAAPLANHGADSWETHEAKPSPDEIYDLPKLVDLALQTNPQTRRAWYAAQAAAAQLGQSRTANYPAVSAEAEGGYFKLPLQFPGQSLVVRNEAFLPQVKVNYDLLDFGRTRARERGAREQLIASNFSFNRTMQDVVFNVERAYYVMSAAKASVSAAEANLALARSSLRAVEDRHQVGLATRPQTLIAAQVEAQAVYDLESSHAMVQAAHAGLAEAIGISPQASLTVRSVEHDPMPDNLGEDVEKLIAEAAKARPNLAAQAAAVRAGDAAIELAHSEFYPKVGIGGNFGQVIWSYTVNSGHTQNLDQPFYGALVTLQWDLFTGFDRYYAERKAIAQRDEARAGLKSLQLEVAAAVWRAYYDFVAAQKKYAASAALVRASEESYSSNLESHQHGLATITDLIGTERDLMAARYTLVQNKADLLVAASALAHALGADPHTSGALP